jgi:hypothetical protein
MIRDGDWTLFDHDFQLKRTTWVRDNSDGSRTFRTDYAVDDILEANADMRRNATSGWTGDYHKVASIPVGVYYDKLAEAYRQNDTGFIKKFLNDSDNSQFRTKEGRV